MVEFEEGRKMTGDVRGSRLLLLEFESHNIPVSAYVDSFRAFTSGRR